MKRIYRSRLHIYLNATCLFITLVFLSVSSYRVMAQQSFKGVVKGETAQGYEFMSGGVGSAERDAIMDAARSYNLALTFAATSGQYLSDVRVLITDQHGKEIVNTITAGPLFYVELPGGLYNITASYDGRSEKIQGLKIPHGGQVSRLFHWNVPVDELTQK